MRTDLQRCRFLRRQLETPLSAPRLILLTGARQTGKTTLARAVYPDLRYVNLWKWVKTAERAVDLAFYRTRSGLEVDLLLTTAHGVLGIEAKSAERLGPVDRRALREVGRALGTSWRGGLVIHAGAKIERLEENVWAVPVDRLLV